MKLGITISIKANHQTRMALIKMHRELKALEAEVSVVLVEEDEQSRKPVFVVVDGMIGRDAIESFRHIVGKMHDAAGVFGVTDKSTAEAMKKDYRIEPLQISEIKPIELKIDNSRQIKQDYRHRQKFHKGKL